MNIFKILSSYDGSIKEPNISSFLAYLLDLYEDHGLSDLLLKSVLMDFQELNAKFFEKIKLSDLTQYDVRINPEYSVFLGNKRRDIDIVIEFYSDNKLEPVYTLCIENKITDSSIQKNDNQLEDELEGLKKEYLENKWATEIYFCFLTLEDSKKSSEEFNNFKYDKKLLLHWKGEKSIQAKILDILEQERKGEIDPISEDSKFLIKSFLAFIKTNFKSSYEEKAERTEKMNYGKPTREHFIDFIQKFEFNQDYEKAFLKKEFTKYIKELCNKDINQGQLACLLYEITVNEKNRVHYNVRADNYESRNILYYPDVNEKKILRRYSKEITDIEVFFKE